MRLLLLLVATLSAVEVGPVPVLKVIDGDTIEVRLDGKPERVRLLYVDTPESADNAHGKRMEEGMQAKAYLSALLPPSREVTLWSPGVELGRDRYGRILAVVTASKWIKYQVSKIEADGSRRVTATKYGPSVQWFIIGMGRSPYWRKYGDAPIPAMHEDLLAAQAVAEYMKAGAWATALDWMRGKANERTSPKK